MADTSATEALTAIDRRFKSGNAVPVERAMIPAAEWFALTDALAQQAATPAVPAGFALVPLRPNREMERVMAEEDWCWEDTLAAAEAVSEEDYNAALQATKQSASPPSADIELLKRVYVHLCGEGPKIGPAFPLLTQMREVIERMATKMQPADRAAPSRGD